MANLKKKNSELIKENNNPLEKNEQFDGRYQDWQHCWEMLMKGKENWPKYWMIGETYQTKMFWKLSEIEKENEYIKKNNFFGFYFAQKQTHK